MRAQLAKRRAAHGGSGAEQQPTPASAALSAADPRELDEEGYGKAGSPAASGIPSDPANAASKRAAYRAMVVMGFG